MSLPDIATREEWLAARKELLVREKDLTRQRDALNADRRRMPMVEISKSYSFGGPQGAVTLADLFGGRTQPVMAHLIEAGKLTIDDLREAEKALRRHSAKERTK